MCFFFATANGKIFSFRFQIFKKFAGGTRIGSSLILNMLSGWAVEICGLVRFYYFLLTDNSMCYSLILRQVYLMPKLAVHFASNQIALSKK